MKDLLRGSYDRSAAGYDAGFRALQEPKYATLLGPSGTWLRSCLPGARSGGALLDLGCGTGLLAEWLAAQGVAIRVVGLDLSFGMLSASGARALARIQGDMDRLPFATGAFDAVLAFTALGIGGAGVARPLAEAARVLRPAGLLGVTILARDVPRGLDEELRAAGFLPGERLACGQDVGVRAVRRP